MYFRNLCRSTTYPAVFLSDAVAGKSTASGGRVVEGCSGLFLAQSDFELQVKYEACCTTSKHKSKYKKGMRLFSFSSLSVIDPTIDCPTTQPFVVKKNRTHNTNGLCSFHLLIVFLPSLLLFSLAVATVSFEFSFYRFISYIKETMVSTSRIRQEPSSILAAHHYVSSCFTFSSSFQRQ